MGHEERLLRRAYDAFNARDIGGALALMHPDVDWPNRMEGGRELGHDAVRAYWTRQFGVIDSHVEPVGFERNADGQVVAVHQIVRDLAGEVLSDGLVRHVYKLKPAWYCAWTPKSNAAAVRSVRPSNKLLLGAFGCHLGNLRTVVPAS